MQRDNEPKIALFIDYDNIAIGLREAGGQIFEVGPIIDRLLEKGRIIYKRAYADWYLFSDGKRRMHEHGIELIDIPMRRNIGKNSADIRMVVDALDLCYTKEHIDTFVIGSGDSDFTPLVAKLKENDKQVIGFGLRAATSNILSNNCDEFIFLEDLVTVPINRPQLPSNLSKRQHDAFNLVLDAVSALMRENKDVLWGSLVKDTIRRKRPSFSEGQYGYSSFSSLLEDAAKHGLIGLIKDPKSGGTPVVTGFGLVGEGGGGKQHGTSAAPTQTRGASLAVQNEAGKMLPTQSGEEDKGKGAKKSEPEARSGDKDNGKASTRKSTSRRSTRKKEEPKAEEKKPAKEEPKAEEKPEKEEKAPAAEEKKEAKPRTRKKAAPKAKPAAEEKVEEKAEEKAENEEKPKPPARSKAKKPAKKEDAPKPEKAEEEPKPVKAEKAREKPVPEKAAPPEKKEEPAKPEKPAEETATPSGNDSDDGDKPRGKPLKTRLRKRKR